MKGINNAQGVSGPDFASLKTRVSDAETTANSALETAEAAAYAVAEINSTVYIVPSQSGTLTYNGSEQSPAWNNYDSGKLTIGGTTSATDAGTYTATFTPVDDYYWSDRTQDTVSVSWTISMATVSSTPTQSGTLTYTGTAQSPTWSNYDSSIMTIGGTTSGTNAGSYTATFTLASNYQWSDGTTDAKSVTWSIGKASISTTPSQSGTLTYTGSALSPSWSNYSSTQLTIGGTTSATAAGSYTATFTPTSNYMWSDGTTSAVSVTWTISKATGSLSLSSTSVTLSLSKASTTVTVTRSGDGTISASSSDTSVATVSVSGTTLTITGTGGGTATITVSVAAGTNYTAPSSKTIAITSTLPSGTLDDNEWSVISSASDAGVASNLWSVGDRKAVTLSGTVGSYTFDGTYYCYILGFDHNSSIEGTNRIHFQFGFTDLSGGTHIAFIDSTYGSSSSSACFHMNSSSTNSGGWESSYMRGTICAEFASALPSELQSVLKTVTKYTDNTGLATNTAECVTATTDTIFLCAEFEVHGSRTYANSYEQNYQAQYSYYSAGNSKRMYRHSSTGSTCSWWVRSPSYNYSTTFCAVTTSGSATGYTASTSRGYAPCFTI